MSIQGEEETTIYRDYDLTETVTQSVAEPINEGRDFFFDCRRISSAKIKGIGIFSSKVSYNELCLLDGKYAKDTKNKFVYLAFLSKTVKGINDCTCQFIKKVNKPTEAATNHSPSFTDSKKVFIVHGTDHQPVEQLKIILKEAGFEPVVLRGTARWKQNPSRKIRKIFKRGFCICFTNP